MTRREAVEMAVFVVVGLLWSWGCALVRLRLGYFPELMTAAVGGQLLAAGFTWWGLRPWRAGWARFQIPYGGSYSFFMLLVAYTIDWTLQR